MNSQIIEIWKYFSLNRVNYLTIEGFAVNIYGYGRNTGDIDIFIEDSVENRENLQEALKQMERDANVKVLVLTGAGKAFCSGQDLKAISDKLILLFKEY